NREDEDLGVGAVADEEREVARPDRFVDEARRARQKEQRVESEQHQWAVLGAIRCAARWTKSAHVGSVIAIRGRVGSPRTGDSDADQAKRFAAVRKGSERMVHGHSADRSSFPGSPAGAGGGECS